jgi:threonine aldolase
MFFASDNTSGAAPEIMAAVTASNDGYAASYGSDDLMDRVRDLIRAIFEAPEAAVLLVPTGTAANALSLALLTPPWGAVFCHDQSHIAVDECGAPEFYTGGAKLIGIGGAHGRIDPDALAQAIASDVHASVHGVQRACLSITNVTEAGTVYTPTEVARLAGIAKAAGMGVHMDGARFANAIVAAGCTPAEMTWKVGVDILSFGGTKNGCLGAEAVVIFDPAKAWEFELRRKRAGHLFSKHRFLSAQMAAYLTDGHWLRLAAQANAMGARLAAGIAALPGGRLTHPTQASMVFAGFPRAGHSRAQAAGARYNMIPFAQSLNGPGDEALTARLVCSWSTTEADVDRFLTVIRG